MLGKLKENPELCDIRRDKEIESGCAMLKNMERNSKMLIQLILLYVGDIDEEILQEIMEQITKAIAVFNIPSASNGKELATILNKIVDEFLETRKLPEEYEDVEDLAMGLGCFFGYILVKGYGWEWKGVGNSPETATYCVVSPKGFWVNPCMKYMFKILTEQNIGIDGENDNTVLLLYNMLENADDRPSDKKYTIAW